MNKVKAIMHNKMLYKMKNKGYDYQKIIVDQFCLPGVYYNYLKRYLIKLLVLLLLLKQKIKT